MAIARLVSQKIQEVHFVNKIRPQPKKPDGSQPQLKLVSSFNFSLNFSKDNKQCVAKFYQSVKDSENGEQLFVSVDALGAFACSDVNNDEDKKQIHVQCYDQLFPYVQSTVQNLMQSSGFAGFQLRKAVINPENVVLNRGDAPQQPQKPQFPIV